MRVPQVNERMKEAPAQALRAMFAGIGQLLLISDKLRNRGENDEKKGSEAASAPTSTATATAEKPGAETATAEAAPSEAAPAEAAPVAAPKASAPKAAAPKPADAKAAAPKPAAATKPAAAKAAAPKPAAKAAAPKAAAPATTEVSELPLPNYDDLTVASLRARMRTLTADQLTVLIGYEKEHANREDVISMFERRIAKLAEG